MTDQHKIMVPIDGSEHSKRTMQTAIDLSKARDAQLIVVQIMEPIVYNEASDLFRELKLPNQEELAEQHYEAIETSVAESGIVYERVISHGVPADKILALAEQHQVDTIVIGRHGANMLQRFLLGSVSDRIVHHAKCDVYVVH